jgi:hypothetical protein
MTIQTSQLKYPKSYLLRDNMLGPYVTVCSSARVEAAWSRVTTKVTIGTEYTIFVSWTMIIAISYRRPTWISRTLCWDTHHEECDAGHWMQTSHFCSDQSVLWSWKHVTCVSLSLYIYIYIYICGYKQIITRRDLTFGMLRRVVAKIPITVLRFSL